MTPAHSTTTDTTHSASDPVLVKHEGKIVTITLNRPEDGNRWRRETLYAFEPIVNALHKLKWSHDVDEAIAAHRETRKPRFTGK